MNCIGRSATYLLAICLMLGCSSGENPVVPGEFGRHVQYFNDPMVVFTGGYQDVDLASLVEGPPADPSGDPVEIPPGARHKHVSLRAACVGITPNL